MILRGDNLVTPWGYLGILDSNLWCRFFINGPRHNKFDNFDWISQLCPRLGHGKWAPTQKWLISSFDESVSRSRWSLQEMLVPLKKCYWQDKGPQTLHFRCLGRFLYPNGNTVYWWRVFPFLPIIISYWLWFYCEWWWATSHTICSHHFFKLYLFWMQIVFV